MLCRPVKCVKTVFGRRAAPPPRRPAAPPPENELIKVRSEDENDQEIERNYSVVATTVVRIDGKPGKLADVKAGSTIFLRKADDQIVVRAIDVTSRPKDEDDDPPPAKEAADVAAPETK